MRKKINLIYFVIIFVSFYNVSNAATIYVSNSNSNGFNIGADTNTYSQIQNKATPKLTIASAFLAAVAGDNIIINDGVYNESASLSLDKANTSVNSFNDYGATIRVNGTPTYIFVPSAPNITLGKIILDAQNIANEIIHPGAVFSGFNINGTKMINFKQYAISDVGRMSNLIMDNGWIIESSVNVNYSFGIYLTLGNSTSSIKNGTINMNSNVANTSGIAASISASSSNIFIDNLSINMTQNNINYSIKGITINGASQVSVVNSNFIISATSTEGIIILPNLTIQNSSTTIYGNVITSVNGTGSGHGIAIGNDGGFNSGVAIINPLVYNNTTIGFNHGIGFFAGVNSGIIYNNLIKKGTTSGGGTIGLILKEVNNSKVFSNIIIGGLMTGGGLRAKADLNSIFANNVIIVDSNSSIPILVTDNPDTGHKTTGDYFVNNIIYVPSNVNSYASVVNDTNTAIFETNDYYGNFNSYPWSYGGINYTNFNDWKYYVEPTAYNENPLFTNLENNIYSLLSTSLLINSGTDVLSRNFDYLNNSVPSGPNTDIGAYEFQDNNPPITTDNTDNIWHNSTTTITLICSDGSGLGCGDTYYTIDGSDPNISSATGTSIVLSQNGNYTIKYFSIDKNANIENVKTSINIAKINNTKPITTLNGDKTIEIYTGDTYTDQGATAQDDMDGDITSSIVVNNNLNINNIGTYTITYNVSDSAGNKADEVIRTVIVKARPGGIIWFGNPNNYQINTNNYSNNNYINNTTVINTSTPIIIQKYISPLDNTEKECSPFTKYLKQGSKDNDINQVKLWQAFLNKEVGTKLPITGFLGTKTINAIKLFQAKYAANILKPWNLKKPTGYIYQSTRSYANKIMGCGEGE